MTEAEPGEVEEVQRIRAKIPWLKGNLEKLAGYSQKTRQDAEGFIRDSKALSAALEALARREQTMRALLSTLEQVC